MQREPMIQEAYDAISREFTWLKNELKPEVNREKQIAAELGDRSENAEYHAAKEKLRHIDKRLKYLSNLLGIAQIIDPAELDHSRVCFGTTVTIEESLSGQTQCITITGILESEPQNGLISFKAPLARALMGKSAGDEIAVNLPAGSKTYEIICSEYLPIMALKKEGFFRFSSA